MSVHGATRKMGLHRQADGRGSLQALLHCWRRWILVEVIEDSIIFD